MKNSITLLSTLFMAIAFIVCNEEAMNDTSDPVGQGAAIINISGDIITNTTWVANNTYVLSGLVRVKDGATLTIQPGTRIEGREGVGGGLPGTLMIEKDGWLIANGRRDKPIVFTSNKPAGQRKPGDWGGVILLGEAPVCFDGNPRIEGIPVDPNDPSSGTYGGNFPNDNSGSLWYVRIEYAGFIVEDGNETNGLTMGGVGAGTSISHVQASFCSDDGFQWFGGTANADHLVAYRNNDEDFETDLGWGGTVEFALSIRDTQTPFNLSNNGFESNGNDNEGPSTCLTSGVFTNVTLMGPARPRSGCDMEVNPNFLSGILLRNETRLNIYNSAVFGYPRFQLEEQNAGVTGTLSGIVLGVPDVTNHMLTSNSRAQATNIANFAASNNNTIVTATGCNFIINNTLDEVLGLKVAAWNLPTLEGQAIPDLRPNSGSILLSGAHPGAPAGNTTYRGAFNTTDGNWDIYDGSTWVDWAPNDDF